MAATSKAKPNGDRDIIKRGSLWKKMFQILLSSTTSLKWRIDEYKFDIIANFIFNYDIFLFFH